MSDNLNDKRLNSLSDDAKAGRISRRRFMEGAMAMGLTVAAASTLWSEAAKAQPNSGGRFRCALDDGNTRSPWLIPTATI